MLYAYDEKFVLPISHDEVVHGKGSMLAKMPGDHWQKLANLRTYYAFMWAHPGKKLLFMGQEFAQPSEWSEARELDWWILDQPPHRSMQQLISDLNRVYQETPALWQLDHEHAGFQWIDGGNADQNILSFVRFDQEGNSVAAVVNFSPVPHHNFRLALPREGFWQELLNTDAEVYGGSGVGNFGGVEAVPIAHHGREFSAEITVPPLAAVWLYRAADN
jgi:1,4-alpha-glucan branching enzyme